jgi:hypothetical protein
MIIRLVGADLLHADGRTERHDEVIVTFRNILNGSEKEDIRNTRTKISLSSRKANPYVN